MALDRFGEIPISSDAGKKDDGNGVSENGAERPELAGESSSSGLEPGSPDPVSIPVADSPCPGFGGGKTASPSSSPFLSSFSSWSRVFGIIAATVFLYGLISYFLVPFLITKSLLPVLSRQLSRPVTVDRIVFSPYTLRLYFSEVSVGVRAGVPTGGVPLLSMSALECQVGFSRILDGKLLCDQAVMRDVAARVSYSSEEKRDFADIGSLFFPGILAPGERLWPAWLEIGELTLTGGTLVIDDVDGSRRYQVDEIELFLPGINNADAGTMRLPRLSAVVSGSPVQAEAVRIFDREGRASTGLDLRVTDVSIVPFLDKLFPSTGELRLVDGVGDFDFRIVLPVEQGSAHPVIISGEASVRSIRIDDGQARPVMRAPETRFVFSVTPSQETVLFQDVNIVDPEVHVYMGHASAEEEAGALQFFAGIAAAAVHGSGKLAIDGLRAVNATVHLYRADTEKSDMTWHDAALQVKRYATAAYLERVRVAAAEGVQKTEPGYLVFEFSDRSGPETMKAMLEGQMHPGQGISGRFSATRLDLARYGAFFAWTGFTFEKGAGDLRFTYDYAPGKAAGGEQASTSFLLGNGYLDISDFKLLEKGRETGLVSGKRLTCEGMQVGTATRNLSCRTLTIAGGDFFADFNEKRGQGRRLETDTLRISDSRLRTNFTRNICPQLPDMLLDDLSVQEFEGNGGGRERRRVMTATVGKKGTVRLTGTPGGKKKNSGSGQIHVALQGLDVKMLSPCLASVLKPEVRQGTVHADGSYDPAARRFTGTVSVHDFAAGRKNGTYVTLDGAVGSGVMVDMKNHTVRMSDATITRPVLRPGLVDSENPLDNFIPADQDRLSGLSIDSVRITDGTFSLPWPVILPGYQPVLTDLSGTMTRPGRDGARFAVKGKIDGTVDFSLTGAADAGRVLSYFLEVPDMRFNAFASFLEKKAGIRTEGVRGTWEQERVNRGRTVETVNRLTLHRVYPLPSSRFFLPLALMVDNRASLSVEMRESTFATESPAFLLDRFVTYLEYQAVRADISPYLLLQNDLPGLQPAQEVFFEAGSSVPVGKAFLDEYRKLLEVRPRLGIVLRAWVGDEDRENMRVRAQREAEQARERENLKRKQLREQQRQNLKKKMDELRAGKTGVVVEELEESELDLAPLPPVQVEVTMSMLERLAKERLDAVREYLEQTAGILPGRIRTEKDFAAGKGRVTLGLEPLAGQAGTGEEKDGTARTD